MEHWKVIPLQAIVMGDPTIPKASQWLFARLVTIGFSGDWFRFAFEDVGTPRGICDNIKPLLEKGYILRRGKATQMYEYKLPIERI